MFDFAPRSGYLEVWDFMERETRFSHLILAASPGELGSFFIEKMNELMQDGLCSGQNQDAVQDIILSILKEATTNRLITHAMRNASQVMILRDE